MELLAHVDYLDESIERLSAEIEDRLRPFDQDQRLVDTIPGVNTKTAQVVLAEAGTDISRFPTDRHLSSLGWYLSRTERKRRQTPQR